MALWGCPSSDMSKSEFVKQSEIYQSYILNTYEEKNEIEANVFLRFGGSTGTTLILNDTIGSIVKFNNQIMTARQDAAGAHYTFNQAYVEGKYSFTFTDADKKEYHNFIICNKLNVYNFPKDMNRNEDLELNYVGAAPYVGEQFICEYKDTAMAFSSPFILQNTIKNNKIIVPKSIFNNMKNGPITLQFFRKNEIATQQHGNIVGKIKYTYIGNIVEANLIGENKKTVQ